VPSCPLRTGHRSSVRYKKALSNSKDALARLSGANDYEAVGTLTLRGVAAPLTLPFTLQIDGTFAHAKGHAELSRRIFGIGQGPWATDQWVAFEVGVDIDVVATTGN
jgi:polyisoprenoid-binding protein YceI